MYAVPTEVHQDVHENLSQTLANVKGSEERRPIVSQAEGAAEFEIRLPPDLEAGAYANFLSVWHTGYEFTLDFSVTEPAQPTDTGVKVPCRVVSRIKVLPVGLIFEVLKALNANMTQYENT